jgi:hypothetical protein
MATSNTPRFTTAKKTDPKPAEPKTEPDETGTDDADTGTPTERQPSTEDRLSALEDHCFGVGVRPNYFTDDSEED